MYMNLLTFLALKNPVLTFLKFFENRALLSYKPHSCKKRVVLVDLVTIRKDNSYHELWVPSDNNWKCFDYSNCNY